MPDWSKLKPYQEAPWKSFEELCYQVARRLYSHRGKFTRVDDSGGGDGVEYYLTLPNGDEWGWQSKFYFPNLRLQTAGRKNSIIESLNKSIKNHPNLKKWYLCTPTNFTPSEIKWFNNTLQKIDEDIELVHWGDSEINDYLTSTEFIGIKNTFFGELELDIKWFSSQVEKQFANLNDVYVKELHTQTDIDFRINSLLGDTIFKDWIIGMYEKAQYEYNQYSDTISEFQKIYSEKLPDSINKQISITIVKIKEKQQNINNILLDFVESLDKYHYDQINASDLANDFLLNEEIENLSNVLYEIYDLAHKSKDDLKRLTIIHQILSEPYYYIIEFHDYILEIKAAINNLNINHLHIFGDAGFGKTHYACDVANKRIISKLPALLILGRDFGIGSIIENRILEILDINSNFTWDDFLNTVDSTANAYNTRIPIIIDGLNDSATPSIWKNQLNGFLENVKRFRNIVIITTCRTQYIEPIWESHDPKNCVYNYGFNQEILNEAIIKYFDYYRLKADLTIQPLTQFRHPIYLKIFCEANNHERIEEKEIYIGEQNLFGVFESYLEKCNLTISEKLSKPPSLKIIQQKLDKFAIECWSKNSKHIKFTDAIELLDDKKPTDHDFDWNSSFTKALLDEGLLLSKNWMYEEEVFGFTYDLFGGYSIAKYLLEQCNEQNLKKFVDSKEFREKLLQEDYQKNHPLFEDILRSICNLLPTSHNKHLYQITKNPRAFSASVYALFEVDPKYIDDKAVNLLITLFDKSQNRVIFYRSIKSTVLNTTHKLNAQFLDKILRKLPMNERDISWTEHIRKNTSEFTADIEMFEETCKTKKHLSDIAEERIKLAALYYSWILTSTVRALRDKTTRALYWFGRKYPEELFKLTEQSLTINDTYIPERMLAASYGVAMALHQDLENTNFRENILPKYALILYKLIFKPKALHSTTHILYRDYARHTIEIALLHNKKLLNLKQVKRIKPPFKDGGIRRWKTEQDKNKDEYRGGNYPLGFDFENYTIGSLVRGRAPYDNKHPNYEEIIGNFWWRIYNLGYSLEYFGEIDQKIKNSSYFLGRASNGNKIERYGKKYCWITFYEIAGFLDDKNSLDEYDKYYGRISNTDIDPSFPNNLQKIEIVKKNYLSGGPKELRQWIRKGPIPKINDILVIESINEPGPWVLLDGYIAQEDYGSKRKIFIFPRGFFIKNEYLKLFDEHKNNIKTAGRALPEIENDYYSFAGEIPWADTFTNMKEKHKIETPTGNRVKKRQKIDKESKWFEKNLYADEEIKSGYREIEEDEMISFNVELPVRNFSWESHHSVVNSGQNSYVPSKELSTTLNLNIETQTFDMLDKRGNKASITLQWGEDWHTYHQLIYIRKDLLEKYLRKKKKQLVWIMWGEREYKSEKNEGLKEFVEKYKKAYEDFNTIIYYSDDFS